MSTPPIVERELRGSARRLGTYWLRVVPAGFAVLACLQWFNSRLIAVSPPAVGQGSFHMLSLIGFVFAFASAILTADSISFERREGTLGLLFLTAQKSRDVVLGKFAVLGFVALYALLGAAPIMMLPLTMGGVTGTEVVRVAIASLNTLFLSLAAGLFCSVHARGQAGGILRAYALVALLAFGPICLERFISRWTPMPISMFSPITSARFAFESDYTLNPSGYWLSLAVAHALGWLLLVLATFSLRHNWRRIFASKPARVAAPKARRLIAPPRVLLLDRTNRRRAFAPVARAMLRMRGQKAVAWFAALISFGGSIWNIAVMNQTGSSWAAASTTVIFQLASSALFAFVAGRFIFESRRSGELELLLVTPVGARGILREQRLALLRTVLGPIYLVVVGCVLVSGRSFHLNNDGALGEMILAVCRTASAVLGVLAVCRTAIYFGARTNSPLTMVGSAVALVELFPIALIYLSPLLLVGTGRAFEFWANAVPVLLLLKNIFFIIWSGRRLQREFRAKDRSLLDRGFGWFAGTMSEKMPPGRTSAT